MSTQEIMDALPSITNPAELNRIARYADRLAQHFGKREFRVGQRVAFRERGGQKVIGTVVRVNTKTLTIEQCTSNGLPIYPYGVRVPFSMIEEV